MVKDAGITNKSEMGAVRIGRFAMSSVDSFAVHGWDDVLDNLPGAGEALNIVTRRVLCAYDWLPRLTRVGSIERGLVSTFNLGEDAVYALDACLSRESVQLVDVVCNQAVDSEAVGGVNTDALRWLQDEYPGRVRWAAGKVHAKIYGAVMGNEAFTVVGSGNFANNARVESYVLINSMDVFMFHAAWIGELIRQNGG